jgi:hypothetical protein
MKNFITLFCISILLVCNSNNLFSQDKKFVNNNIIQRNNVTDYSAFSSSSNRNELKVLNNNGAVDTNGRAPQGSRLL